MCLGAIARSVEVALDDRRHIPVEFASLALPLTCVSLGLAGETWLPERLLPTPTRNARVPGGEGDVFVIDSLLSRVIFPSPRRIRLIGWKNARP